MLSAGLELTKLTHTRLEDYLIRHRGDRLHNHTSRCIMIRSIDATSTTYKIVMVWISCATRFAGLLLSSSDKVVVGSISREVLLPLIGQKRNHCLQFGIVIHTSGSYPSMRSMRKRRSRVFGQFCRVLAVSCG